MRPCPFQEDPEKRVKAEERVVHQEEVEEEEEVVVDPDRREKRELLELRVKAEDPDPRVVRSERDVPETTRAKQDLPEPRVEEVAIEVEKPDHIEVEKIAPIEEEKAKPDHTEVAKIALIEEEVKLDHTEVVKIDLKVKSERDVPETTRVKLEDLDPRVEEAATEEKPDPSVVVKIAPIVEVKIDLTEVEKVRPAHIAVARIAPTEEEVKPDHTVVAKIAPSEKIDHTTEVAIELHSEEEPI